MLSVFAVVFDNNGHDDDDKDSRENSYLLLLVIYKCTYELENSQAQ